MVLLLVGCATAAPPALVEARRNYSTLGIDADPNDADTARRALVAANRELDERGDTVYARDLAYVAARRTDVAAANARAEQHRRRSAWLTTEAVTLKTQARQRAAPAPLVAATDEEAVTSPNDWAVWPAPAPEPQLAREAAPAPPPAAPKVAPRPAAAEAAPPEPDVAEQLATFSTTRDEPRGTVITIAAALVFAPGRTSLSDASHDRLEQVAKLLAHDDRQVTVEVYTDNLGSADENLKLSAERAKAVRDALVSYGVPMGRVQARGLGSVKPVTENTTPAGRATNRRLEIVLHGYNKPVS
jgi:outer membrane protein OmpA-like peptidoglycan-associated protein